MSIHTKLVFDVLTSEELYFQFVLFMYYSEHIEDCHYEDRSEFTNRLFICKNALLKSQNNPQLNDPVLFESCVDNTFGLIWEDEKTFIEEYMMWVQVTHTITI